MPTTVLALALALATQAPGESPADLAARVAAAGADPAAREEAEGRLEEIGRAALPDLRIALTKAEDPAGARRLADLVELIERKRLLRPTTVALKVENVPPAEAVAAITRQSGLLAVLDPPDDPAWTTARVTLDTRGPVPFWEAIDRLGASAGFRVEAGSYWPGSPRDVPAVRLVRGEGLPIRPSYAGPYRVELMGVERHRRVTLPKPGRTAKVVDELTATLQLVAEPGLVVDRNGSPRVLEALDDLGADLRPGSPRDATPPGMGVAFRQWRTTLEAETLRVPLATPPGPSKALTRFRGVVPILAYARTGPILNLPLGAALNRPLASSGVTLTVHKFGPHPSGPFVWGLQAVVSGEPRPTGPTTAAGPRQLTLTPVRPAYQPDDHFQVLDDRGRPFILSSHQNVQRPDGAVDLTILIHGNNQQGPPATLRYYGLVAEATEVPFAFENVPMP